MRQRSLFGEPQPAFTNRNPKATTFLGKLLLPIHRWYRLTPSFSPRLADDIATHFALEESDFVLDPFSGVGTVPLCMKYRGIPACSVEINPYLHFVGTIKTRTYREIDEIADTFADFSRLATKALVEARSSPARYLADNADAIPRLHKIERWWSDGNLAQLVCIRSQLAAYRCPDVHADLLLMGLLAILVPISNAKHNHVSLTFAEKPLPTVDVGGALTAKYAEMLKDIRAVQGQPCSSVNVYLGNSKALPSVLPRSPKVSAVITSPPYPNRFSYARETRPHLFVGDFIESAEAVGELEMDAIGGTWGKATSVLADGVEPKNEIIRSLLAPHNDGIHDNGSLMAHYITKYFNDMFDHAAAISQVCRANCRLAYVIGNSMFYGHPLPSDEILAAVFGQFGFDLERIDRMRKRQSKRGLYEAVVFMRR